MFFFSLLSFFHSTLFISHYQVLCFFTFIIFIQALGKVLHERKVSTWDIQCRPQSFCLMSGNTFTSQVLAALVYRRYQNFCSCSSTSSTLIYQQMVCILEIIHILHELTKKSPKKSIFGQKFRKQVPRTYQD